ncbi:MAG: tRNA (guanosine(37)-N1)-methyltransferase TrmD [Candidatus Liptonbacteria bacterium]|nr:tRNA (guanosine(37)-N1)-methyltransferase TrmD [Candidatus Liptonbacteria bacterium]
MRFDIITIFPKIFDSYLAESLLRRAQKEGLLAVKIHNLRDFASGRHTQARPTGSVGRAERKWSFGQVDDRAFGGGPGMVLKIEPIYRVVATAKRKAQSAKRQKVILFSTRGRKLDAKIAKRLAMCDQLILICGRYEGVDERVAEHIADEEISIGDYVLSGGELPALVLMEAVSRFLPGFLGKRESLEEIKGSYPVYTRPEVFAAGRKKLAVPKVLLSGDHKKIEEWRRKNNNNSIM